MQVNLSAILISLCLFYANGQFTLPAGGLSGLFGTNNGQNPASQGTLPNGLAGLGVGGNQLSGLFGTNNGQNPVISGTFPNDLAALGGGGNQLSGLFGTNNGQNPALPGLEPGTNGGPIGQIADPLGVHGGATNGAGGNQQMSQQEYALMMSMLDLDHAEGRQGGNQGGGGGLFGGSGAGGGGGGSGGGMFGGSGSPITGVMNMMKQLPTAMTGLREAMTKNQLTPITKFIVGDTATPSPEMVNYGMIAQGPPTTEFERASYLKMLKKIARNTPETVAKFITNTTVNGVTVPMLDTVKLDAHITKRSMEYGLLLDARKQRETQKAKAETQMTLDRLKLQHMHELNMLGLHLPLDSGIAGSYVAQDPSKLSATTAAPTTVSPQNFNFMPTTDPFLGNMFLFKK